MKKINPNEAPNGYTAEGTKYHRCLGCDFWDVKSSKFLCSDEDSKCIPSRRKDCCDVIFKKNLFLNIKTFAQISKKKKICRELISSAKGFRDLGCFEIAEKLDQFRYDAIDN